MHCLLIHQVFVGPENVGGSRHFELGCLLAKQNNVFSVVTSNLDYITGSPRPRGLPAEIDVSPGRIQVAHAWTPAVIHRSFVWRVFAFLSFMVTSVFRALTVRKVDLVMGTSPPIFQCLSAWLVALVKRRPFLLEVRDLWPEFAIDMGVLKNPVLIWFSRRLEMFLYNRADHILVNSPAYREYLLGKGIADRKISVIPNGVDPREFDPDDDGGGFRDEIGVSRDAFVAAYVGALGMANDIPTILRAASRVKERAREVVFLIVGDGKERQKLEEMARREGLKNVRILGAVPKRRVPEVLAAANVVLATLMDIPMFRTTYPNKVFDCMAAGRPIIIGIDGVIRKVVESAGGGVSVPPGDDEAIADAVITIMKDPDGSRRMGDAARSYVEKHFDRHIQSVAFVQLVQELGRR